MEQIHLYDSKRRFVVIAACALIGVLLVFGYLYVGSRDKNEEQMKDMNVYQEIYKNANSLTAQGKTDEAIKQYESLLKSAPDKFDEGKLRILIASNTYYSPTGESIANKEKGINLFKSIISDESLPQVTKAIAYNTLANHIVLESDLFYEKLLSDGAYGAYLPSEGSSGSRVREAYKNILEQSLNVFPTSYAAYALAGNYYTIEITSTTSPLNKDTIAKETQKLIRQGDTLNDRSLYTRSVYVQSLFYRALGLNSSDRILSNISLEERDLAFKKIIDLTNEASKDNDQATLTIITRARLWYAYFLYENYKDGKKDDIVALLKPFSDLKNDTSISSKNTKAFLKVVYADTGSFRLKLVKSLREVSPDLDSLLKSINL